MELKIETGNISNKGSLLQIKDVSDWTQSDLNDREEYGVFLRGEFRLDFNPSEVAISNEAPADAVEWGAQTNKDGRYSFTALAFYLIGASPVLQVDEVRFDEVEGSLKQYNGADWVEVELADVLDKAVYTSEILEVPYLYFAREYKNKLNLDYITQVRGDIANGAEQNKLYYKRTDLDYVNALIDGTEYNWALGLLSNFYDMVQSLNGIIENKTI